MTGYDHLADGFLRGGLKLLIGGDWVPSRSGATFQSIDPSTGRTLGHVAEADVVDVDAAVEAARRAFDGEWRRYSSVRRQNLLLAFADKVFDNYEELHLLESLDMGMPFGTDHSAGARRETELLRYYAGWPTKIAGETLPNSVPDMLTFTEREPVGVVASIVPWNGPLSNALWKIAPVLASGCTMVLKPAEQASLAAVRLGELLCELSDLPPGVVNIVTGPGETVGARLAAHPDVDKVAFTGSTATGQAIVRAASAGNLKRVSLELGGKSADIVFADADIVFADADLAVAIPTAAMAVFNNAGQMCTAGSRLFVERTIYDDVLSGLAQFASSLKVGPSLDLGTQIGPVVSEIQLERASGYLALAQAEGARTVVGGSRLSDGALADGFFVQPTVVADVDDRMRVAQEEIFGPVICVLPFDDQQEVVDRANATVYGLGGGVWTRDIARGHAVATALRTGTVWVNTYLHLDPAVPFGGYKMSGWGHELGSLGLSEYLTTKSVWIDVSQR